MHTPQLIIAIFLYLPILGCRSEPITIQTSTPSPSPTPTAIPIPTATYTWGTITGRIYWDVSGEPIQTNVFLYRITPDGKYNGEVRGETNGEGVYSFIVEEPGTYYITASTEILKSNCIHNVRNPRPRDRGGWPLDFIKVDDFSNDSTGVVSRNLYVEIGEIITLDCALFCAPK